MVIARSLYTLTTDFPAHVPGEDTVSLTIGSGMKVWWDPHEVASRPDRAVVLLEYMRTFEVDRKMLDDNAVKFHA